MTEPGRQADVQRIMQLIPHRPPFLLIDRVEDIRLGESAVGIKNVTIGEPYFPGHFPARAVMPGVLIIEAMAQTSAVLVVETLGEENKVERIYFMSIYSAQFRRPVVPGDALKLHVTKQRSRGRVWRFAGEARVDGKLAAEAVFTAMIMDDE